jgi:ubiquinone/menaquinone biosynthesis C-methylase UbiE
VSSYIHGSKPEEQKRLSVMNQLMNQRCLALMELHEGERVIDIGSGLGQYTLEMARAVGSNGFCLGIERDQQQLEGARLNLAAEKGLRGVEFRKGEVEQLPLKDNEWSSFDVGHARFVLEHLSRPQAAMTGLVKAIRPGGKVVLEDDDHASLILCPEPAGFGPLWTAYIRSYDRLGNDPFIGRRLVSLLYEAGLRDLRNDVVFFGDCFGTPTFDNFVNNLIGVIESARPTMIGGRLIEETSMDEAFSNLREWARLPYAALWYEIYWASGKKPV